MTIGFADSNAQTQYKDRGNTLGVCERNIERERRGRKRVLHFPKDLPPSTSVLYDPSWVTNALPPSHNVWNSFHLFFSFELYSHWKPLNPASSLISLINILRATLLSTQFSFYALILLTIKFLVWLTFALLVIFYVQCMELASRPWNVFYKKIVVDDVVV